jgi:hypothetical protein
VIVSVDQQTRTARLREADDFRHFHVEAGSPAAAAEVDGIEPTGEPGSVWVSVDALRRWPGDRSAEWDAGFTAMCRAAKSAGWLDPDGTSIRAHIEPSA